MYMYTCSYLYMHMYMYIHAHVYTWVHRILDEAKCKCTVCIPPVASDIADSDTSTPFDDELTWPIPGNRSNTVKRR